MRRVTGETADLRRIGDEFLRVDLAGFGPLNKSFVGMATLAIVGVRITGIAERPMAGSLVLTAYPADRELRLRAMAVDTAFRKNAVLRF